MNNNGELNNVNTTAAATPAPAEPKLTPLPADQETVTAQMEVINATNEATQTQTPAEPQIVSAEPTIVAQEAVTPVIESTETVAEIQTTETPTPAPQETPTEPQVTSEDQSQAKYESDIQSMTITLDSLNGKPDEPETEPIEVPTEPVVQEVPTEPQNLSKKEQKKLQKEQAKQAKQMAKQGLNPDGTPMEQAPVQQGGGGGFFKTLILLAIVVLIGYIVYTNKSYQARIDNLKYACTPVTTNTKEEQLSLDSTLVQELYSKVKTTIKEDYAQTEWDNKMKLYLAYRQIPVNEKYPSNCNMFNNIHMEPFVCEVSSSFVPQAFKIEALELEFKKLFGEETPYVLDDIKLDRGCVGGYQYIPERQEYVEGTCPQQASIPIKATKKLTEARSYRNTIILVETVKYTGSDKAEIPSYLKSGTYFYTFRLDMNYNFVFVSKTYEDLY